MRKTLKLAFREYKAAVKTKGFVIGLVIAPILMSGGVLGILLFRDQVDTTDKTIAVIDRSNEIAPFLVAAATERNEAFVYHENTGKKVQPAYLIEVFPPDETNADQQRLDLSNRIRATQLHAFLDIGSDVIHPGENMNARRIAYHAENAALDEVRGWITGPINTRLRQLRLADADIEESDVPDLFYWINVEAMGLVSVDTETGDVEDAHRSSEAEAIFVPMIMLFLMFIMIMMGAMPLLYSVMEEKGQRITEVLLGSLKPFELMMGKVLGGVGVSVTGSLVYVVGGIFAVQQMGLSRYLPYHILPWFFVYMVLAIFMFGSLLASLGSACNDAKEAQSITIPAMLPMMIPMFVLVPVLEQPQSTFATWLSLFPPCTPLLMLIRQATPEGVPWWQPWIGLLGVLITTAFIIWAGGRIFRIGILMQGQPPKLGNILKWVFKG